MNPTTDELEKHVGLFYSGSEWSTMTQMRFLLAIPLAAVCAFCSPRPLVPISFEKNSGQTSSEVRYLGRAPGAKIWLLDSGAVLGLNLKGRQAVLRMTVEGAKRHARIDATEPLGARANYFIGNDPAKWRTHVPLYARVSYHDLYPGIDLTFRGGGQSLEYDWILAPGADPRAIRMSFEGADHITIEEGGDLVLGMGDFQVRHKRPRLLQDGREVAGHFARRGSAIGFEVAGYDTTRPLIIDPVLTYASYLGGAEADFANGVAIDPQGALLLVGGTSSINLPAKNGLFLSPPNTNGYAMVAKFAPTASGADSLLWLSFVGGSYYEQGEAIATDSAGAVYITGYTESANFPTKNPFQPKFATTYNCTFAGINGTDFTAPCDDAFISKLAPTGDMLIYSSYLGGEADDGGLAVFVDSAGIAYVAGFSGSPDFNTTPTAYQRKLNGALGSSFNGFVAKVDPAGKLLYSTLIGGQGSDFARGVTVDSQGDVVLVGDTTSTNFPTANALKAGLSATRDGFVAELKTSLLGSAQLIYSTFMGGTGGNTSLRGVAVDTQGAIYAVGGTNSAQYPTTGQSTTAVALLPRVNAAPDPNDPNPLGLLQDAVVTKLNPAIAGQAQLIYSTYFGGSGYDDAYGVALDSAGKIVVAGATDSQDFPVTADGFQQVYSAAPFSPFAFIAKIDSSPQAPASVAYASYYGVGDEIAYGVAVNATSIAIAGTAYAAGLPVTPGGFQQKFGGGGTVGSANVLIGDAFIAGFDTTKTGPIITAATNAASFAAAGQGAAPGEMVTFFGSNLGPSSLVGSVLDAEGKLPTTVEGCQVLADGNPSPIVYVWTNQTSVILPYELTPKIGSASIFVQIVCNGMAGNLFPLKIVGSAPGIFSAGDGQAAVLNANGSANSASNPAAKGSLVQIFATGEGVLSPAGVDGRIENGPVATIPKPVLPVSVTFGGILSPKLTYAAVAPDAVDGLLQVDAQIPSGVASGNVEIVLIVGNGQSPKGLNIAVK